MSDIYLDHALASKNSWEGEAVSHPDAVRSLAEEKYGLKKGERLTIALLDDMLQDAEKAGNTKRIRQINLAKTFVRQARKRHKHRHKATATVSSMLAVANVGHLVVTAGTAGLDDFLAVTDKFETHKPVTIEYLHNETKAPNFGARFAQDIEPAGFYFVERDTPNIPVPEGWSTGTLEITNPLVLDWGSGSYQSSDSWKQVLYRVYGLTGKALSNKLRTQGFTHIITISNGHSMEMVDIRGLRRGR